jgi:hypothetical protein
MIMDAFLPSPLRGGAGDGGSDFSTNVSAFFGARTPTLNPSPQGGGKPALWLPDFCP